MAIGNLSMPEKQIFTLPTGDTVLATTGTPETNETITVGGSRTGYINTSGDHDWFAITLAPGSYAFTLTATSGGVDPYLYLRNSSGALLASNDDSGGLNSRIVFQVTTAGTYYLDAGAFGTTTGGYTLAAQTYVPPPVYTNDQIASYLTTGYWGGSVTHWVPGSAITFNVQGLLSAQQTLARTAFALWQDVCNLTFVETTSTAQIMLDDTSSGAFANWSSSGGVTTSATVNVQQSWSGEGNNPGLDSYTFQTFLHEIGHTLGLGHGGPYNGSASYGVDNIYANDTWGWTIMSYFNQSNYNGASYRFLAGPMAADILAIQQIYGANTTTRAGDTVYGHNATAGATFNFANYTTAPAFTIWDGGGTDTLDASGYSVAQTINLNAERFSSIGGINQNINIARNTVIENAVGGGGADTIYGNAVANQLSGLGGVDMIDSGEGNDTVYGGEGGDTLIARGGADLVYGEGGADIVDGGVGSDIIFGGLGNDSIYAYLGDDAIYGQDNNDFIYGDGGNDTMTGGVGNDDVRGADGDDIVWGGSGNDYYFGGAGLDQFFVMDGGIITNEFDAILDFQDTDVGGATNDYVVLPNAARYASMIFDQSGYTWIASWDPAAPAGLHYNAIVGTSASAIVNNILYV